MIKVQRQGSFLAAVFLFHRKVITSVSSVNGTLSLIIRFGFGNKCIASHRYFRFLFSVMDAQIKKARNKRDNKAEYKPDRCTSDI